VSQAERGVAFAFAPFPSYMKLALRRTPGAVKGAQFLRVHRSAAETLDGEDDRITLVSEGKGASNSLLPQANSVCRIALRAERRLFGWLFRLVLVARRTASSLRRCQSLHYKERETDRTEAKGEQRRGPRYRWAARSSGRDRLVLARLAAGYRGHSGA
jgi:hypothetical protein